MGTKTPKAGKKAVAATMGSVARSCATCHTPHEVAFLSTPRTNARNMAKAELELDALIDGCPHTGQAPAEDPEPKLGKPLRKVDRTIVDESYVEEPIPSQEDLAEAKGEEFE